MQIFRRKPFMLCCFCFIVSFVVAYNVEGWVKFIFATLTICASFITVIALPLTKRREIRIKLTVFLIAFLMSFAAIVESYIYYDIHMTSLDKYIGRESEIELTLIEERYVSTDASRYLAKLTTIDGESCSAKVIVEFEGECGFSEGQKLLLNAECVPIEEYAFNNNVKLAYIADGIVGSFTVSSDAKTKVIGEEKLARLFLSSLNRNLVYKTEDIVDGEAGRLCSALFLGRRDRLSDETVRDFGRVGLSHSLALSGMHMAILAGFVDLIFRKICVPKSVRCVIMPAIMLAYLALTGFSLSTVRAALMLTAVYISYIIASPIDKLTVLFSSCVLILAFFPSSVADIGFWMSYLSTFSLIVVSPYLSKLLKNRSGYGKKRSLFGGLVLLFKHTCNSLLITVTAVLSVMLLTQIYFGELSIVAPISNLLCGTAIMAFFALTLLLVLFGQISFVARLLSPAVKILGDFILNITSKLSDAKNVTVSLENTYSYVIVITFTFIMAFLLVVKLKRRVVVIIPAIVGIIAFVICMSVASVLNKEMAYLKYLRRGEREMFVLVEDGESSIIDMSDGNYSNYTIAWNEARLMGATDIETFIITHYHSKHAYSISRLMSNVKVRYVMLPNPDSKEDADVLKRIYEISRSHGAECVMYEKEEQIEALSEVEFCLLPSDKLPRSSQPTVAFSIKYGESELAYIGSSYFESKYSDDAENAISSSDIVIYGTHGPNPKASYSIDSAKNVKEIVFADKEQAELASLEDSYLSAEQIVCECEIRNFKLELIPKEQ